jgi:AAA-like domain
MKPQGWDPFLMQMVLDYRLRGKLKEIFLVRFAYENWRKPDKLVWELAEAASYETYKKHMTTIYAQFSQTDLEGCPELDSQGKGPGKFNILRDWLKEKKYVEWHQSSLMSTNHSLSRFELRSPVNSDSPLYIERPPLEADCYQEILKPGALIRIKAPEKMGKTSLLRKILLYAEANGSQTVYLNLREAEGAVFSSLDKFLRWFCANVSRELGIQPRLDDYWAEELYGSMMSCKTYFQDYLLRNIEGSLTLGLDNVDRVFEYLEIAQDFLPMLRSWHEEAHSQESWQQFRLAIAHATEIYIDIDANQSPFNVGWPVQLTGFNFGQVQTLAKAYGLDWATDADLRNATLLVEMLAGHPYLVKLALNALVHQDMTLETLLKEAPTQGGIYGDHLRSHWDNFQRQPELAAAMKKVVTAEQGVPLGPTQAYKLDSMGLVKLQGDEVAPSCELYRQYFRARL